MGLLEGVENIGDLDAAAVGSADFGEADFAVGVEDEGGGIGCFFGGVPAEAVGGCEGVVGVEEEVEVVGEGLSAQEFVGVGFEAFGGAGIDEDDARLEVGQGLGLGDELGDLTATDGTLVSGIAAEHDQDDGAIGGDLGKLDGLAGD